MLGQFYLNQDVMNKAVVFIPPETFETESDTFPSGQVYKSKPQGGVENEVIKMYNIS